MSKALPLISICIPSYHREAYLRRLLDSIRLQTYTHYEVIISDDSKDNGVERLATEYAKIFPVMYSRNNSPAGTPANWNIAISKATGEWIKIMHDDDWFSSGSALQKFAETARDKGCPFIFSACNNIHPGGKSVNEFLEGWKKDMLAENPLNLMYANVIGHPSTVMHRRDEDILYDTRFKWVVDIDFYIRYLQKHNGYAYIPEMLVNIGTDDTQVSGALYKNPSVEVPEYLAMLAKYPSGLLMEHEYVFHCVWNLVRRFRIKDINTIKMFGYEGRLPDHVQSIIDFQQHIPRLILKQTNWSKALMKKCYRKLKAQGL
jgi:glycosyltransferase involved in cell wall biosynthesis